MSDANDDCSFNALRNAIYHTARKQFYDGLNRLLNFLVIILGAGAAGKLSHTLHFLDDVWLEFGVLVFATLQLTFDFGYKARTHEFLQRRYYELLSEIELDTKAEATAKWNARLQTIASDEPMPMRALDALAYNAAVDATVVDESKRNAALLRVPILHRLLKHFIARSGYAYQSRAVQVDWWQRLLDNFRT